MTDHWCIYCNGMNTHNCQFNANLPRMEVYTTNTTAAQPKTRPLRAVLGLYRPSCWPRMACRVRQTPRLP